MKVYLKLVLLLLLFITAFASSATASRSLHVTTDSSSKGEIKIAMAQIFCSDGDRAGNFVRIENTIIDAKNRKAEIVVFPESCILGWVNPTAFQKAFPIPGEDSRRLCELAKKYKIYICIGVDEKDGDNLYDAALLIDDKGNILLKHRKINVLPELMNPSYSSGNNVNVAKTKFGNIGILICADTFEKKYWIA